MVRGQRFAFRAALLATATVAGAVCVAAAARQYSSDDDARARRLRSELQGLLSHEGSDELLSAYWKLMYEKHGVVLWLRFGERWPIGHGVDLSYKPSNGSGWTLLAPSDEETTYPEWGVSVPRDEEIRIPKGQFVRYVTEEGVAEEAAADLSGADATVLIGSGETALFVELATAMVGTAEVGPSSGRRMTIGLTGAGEVRKLARSLLAHEEADQLARAYWRHMEEEHGVRPTEVLDGKVQISHGVEVLYERSNDGEWVLRVAGEQEFAIPKGQFVRYVTEEGVLEKVPADLAAAHATLFLGCGDVALLLDLSDLTVRRVEPGKQE